jgi:hypothetical protein
MSPIANTVSLTKQNAFYNIDVNDEFLYIQGLSKLKHALSFNPETNQIAYQGIESLSAITSALMDIESAKLNTIARIAKHRLSNNVNEKMVIVLNYTDSIYTLVHMLEEFGPLILNGSVKKTDRDHISALFREDNNNSRLLICNLTVVSVGIDLDDKHGGRPRFCLVNPNYRTIDLYQLGHRFQRMDTKSDSTIQFIYGKKSHELSVLKALTSKSEIMKTTTEEQANAGVQFLCDIPSWYEEDIPIIPSLYDEGNVNIPIIPYEQYATYDEPITTIGSAKNKFIKIKKEPL